MNMAKFAYKIDDKASYLMHFKFQFKMLSLRNSLRNKFTTTLHERHTFCNDNQFEGVKIHETFNSFQSWETGIFLHQAGTCFLQNDDIPSNHSPHTRTTDSISHIQKLQCTKEKTSTSIFAIKKMDASF